MFSQETKKWLNVSFSQYSGITPCIEVYITLPRSRGIPKNTIHETEKFIKNFQQSMNDNSIEVESIDASRWGIHVICSIENGKLLNQLLGKMLDKELPILEYT